MPQVAATTRDLELIAERSGRDLKCSKTPFGCKAVVTCGTFDTFEEALRYLELNKSILSADDAARLDKDGDGVPFMATSERERYRMKVPRSSL